MNTILQDGLSGRIQDELWRLGYKCRASRLAWFTDKPIHAKSQDISSRYSHKLTQPYFTRLTPKTALVFYMELQKMKTPGGKK